MFTVRKSIDVDFAHHVGGHDGACINLHGHTWKFEVELGASELNEMGFVVDFSLLKSRVLKPVHDLLDHSLSLYKGTLDKIREPLLTIGDVLQSTRPAPAGQDAGGEWMNLGYTFLTQPLNGAENEIVGGIKITHFPFSPTSEKLAKWLYDVAFHALADHRVSVESASVYETLHPVEAVATYWGE